MLNNFQSSRYTVDLPGYAAVINRTLALALYCIGPPGGCGRMGPAPGTRPVGCRRYGAPGPSKLHMWVLMSEPLRWNHSTAWKAVWARLCPPTGSRELAVPLYNEFFKPPNLSTHLIPFCRV